jgi:uncharacterized membrane protein YphA (DoxX/SURF4 family)
MYPSSQRTPGTTAEDISLLLLRLAAVTVLVIFKLIPEATAGWAAIWHEKTWALADTIGSLGIPQAQWIAASAVVLIVLATLGLAIGFVTRFSATVLLFCAGLLCYSAVQQTEVTVLETALVYGCIFLFLLLRGPGNLAADRYFRTADD